MSVQPTSNPSSSSTCHDNDLEGDECDISRGHV
jgi:hypothetical protein